MQTFIASDFETAIYFPFFLTYFRSFRSQNSRSLSFGLLEKAVRQTKARRLGAVKKAITAALISFAHSIVRPFSNRFQIAILRAIQKPIKSTNAVRESVVKCKFLSRFHRPITCKNGFRTQIGFTWQNAFFESILESREKTRFCIPNWNHVENSIF